MLPAPVQTLTRRIVFARQTILSGLRQLTNAGAFQMLITTAVFVLYVDLDRCQLMINQNAIV